MMQYLYAVLPKGIRTRCVFIATLIEFLPHLDLCRHYRSRLILWRKTNYGMILTIAVQTILLKFWSQLDRMAKCQRFPRWDTLRNGLCLRGFLLWPLLDCCWHVNFCAFHPSVVDITDLSSSSYVRLLFPNSITWNGRQRVLSFGRASGLAFDNEVFGGFWRMIRWFCSAGESVFSIWCDRIWNWRPPRSFYGLCIIE